MEKDPVSWYNSGAWAQGAGLDEARRAFASYHEHLVALNRRLNLTSERAEDDFIRDHIIDSIIVLRDEAAQRESAACVDIGSGGGLPGLPVAIARPSWTVVLVEAVRKKAEALRELIEALRLKNASVVWNRAEDMGRQDAHREHYDLAFCRAVGSLAETAELTLPFLRVGGAWLAHRGSEAPQEAEAALRAVHLLGGDTPALSEYRLPDKDKPRHIVRVNKVQPTPPAYPRRNGLPAKRPLA